MNELIEQHSNTLLKILDNPDKFKQINVNNVNNDWRLNQGFYIKLKHFALQIDASNIPFHQAFNVGDINPQQLQAIQNEYIENSLISAYDGYDTEYCPLASMSYNDNNYWLEIYIEESLYVDKCIKYKLSRENMKKVLYNILSYGVIPRDSNNGYKIKLTS